MVETMSRYVLLIAFHFPPVRHSSGIQRTLKFATYLRDHGWKPIVLTVHSRAHANVGEDQMGEIPEDVIVHRAFALDTGRHLSIGGRYLGFMAMPDRFRSWWLGGVFSGWRLIRKYRPAVIWSTYPIPTAHNIGATLQKISGLPWVADFRDSMTDEGYPEEPKKWRLFRNIEEKIVRRCSTAVFTTPGARSMYAQRYAEYADDHWAVIPNGYDEGNFVSAEQGLTVPQRTQKVFVHAGILYPSERDPRPFFRALSELKKRRVISTETLKVVLRATAHDDLFQPMLDDMDIADIVELAPSVAYEEALREMLSADGLLLFQAANCNHQIPAKLYEYIRSQRPVFSLTDDAGDTAYTLREAGLNDIVPLDDAEAIEIGLNEFVGRVNTGLAVGASAGISAGYSRAAGAGQLANLFEKLL